MARKERLPGRRRARESREAGKIETVNKKFREAAFAPFAARGRAAC